MPAIAGGQPWFRGDVLVDLEAALGGERVGLQVRILVGGAELGVSDPILCPTGPLNRNADPNVVA